MCIRDSIRRGKKHDVTEIFKNIKKAVSECEDSEIKNYILEELEKGTFLPKQITAENGVIPNQVHKKELKKILDNAGKYLTFLNEKDDTGYTVSEKIVQLFEFRIPYYVGPLFNDGEKDSFAWSVRKENGVVSVSYTHLDVYKRQVHIVTIQIPGR